MDNVLGLGLAGVICCLYHQEWRASERERGERRRETDRGQQTASPHYSQILLGVDQTGAIWSLNFKECHCLFLASISLDFNNTKRDTHTPPVNTHTHTWRPISGLWELIIFPDEWCHALPGSVSCHHVTLWRRGSSGDSRAEGGGGGGHNGDQAVGLRGITWCLWRFWWFICWVLEGLIYY